MLRDVLWLYEQHVDALPCYRWEAVSLPHFCTNGQDAHSDEQSGGPLCCNNMVLSGHLLKLLPVSYHEKDSA